MRLASVAKSSAPFAAFRHTFTRSIKEVEQGAKAKRKLAQPLFGGKQAGVTMQGESGFFPSCSDSVEAARTERKGKRGERSARGGRKSCMKP